MIDINAYLKEPTEAHNITRHMEDLMPFTGDTDKEYQNSVVGADLVLSYGTKERVRGRRPHFQRLHDGNRRYSHSNFGQCFSSEREFFQRD
jgi:hypothetical protein